MLAVRGKAPWGVVVESLEVLVSVEGAGFVLAIVVCGLESLSCLSGVWLATVFLSLFVVCDVWFLVCGIWLLSLLA